jgi:hypothetical protein
MEVIWHFFGKKQNRVVLSWLGSGVVIIIGGLWAAFIFFSEKKPSDPCIGAGAVTIGRDVNGSTITTSGSGPTNCNRRAG